MYTDDSYLIEVFSGASRLLNAVTGGDGSVTFSAWSWFEAEHRKTRKGRICVSIIDKVLGQGHCKEGFDWHVEKQVFTPTALELIRST